MVSRGDLVLKVSTERLQKTIRHGFTFKLHLQACRPLFIKRLQWQLKIVRYCKGSQVVVVFGVNGTGHIDVELETLEELAACFGVKFVDLFEMRSPK